REKIDSELRLVALRRQAIREQGGGAGVRGGGRPTAPSARLDSRQ
ncbi:hypothetical protein MUNTM_11950, partial [Mycobacterium sp. MUNTM1]